jgi:hypothetical protein
MKKNLWIATIMLLKFILINNLSAATYDLTGTWNFTLSEKWAQGDRGCVPGPDTSGTFEIIQHDDELFMLVGFEGVDQGTIVGDMYTASGTITASGGDVQSSLTFIPLSETSAEGTIHCVFIDPSDTWHCQWGGNITLEKCDEDGEDGEDGDENGTWYTLTMDTIGSGTVNPEAGFYSPGTTVQLTANADADWQFFCWIGDVADTHSASTTVTMDADKTVTALFVQSGTAVDGGPADGAMLFLSGGVFEGEPTSIEPPGEAPGVFPFGLFEFRIAEVSEGGSVTVACTMPDDIPEGAVYYKYENGEYSKYDNATGLDDGDNFLTITLTDGGPGDADAEANGLIVDPGGIALQTALYFPHVATTNDWETEIALINTSCDQNITGTLEGYSNSGDLIETMRIALLPGGRRQIAIAEEFADHADIGYMFFDTQYATVKGYTKFYKQKKYRTAIPAVKKINTGDIYVPHIASNSNWWTGLSLVNTTQFQKTLTIHFSNGTTRQVQLLAGEHKVFTIKSLFGGVSQPNIETAFITGGKGVIGLELFSRGNLLSGVLLKDESANTIYFPHVPDFEKWWTGITAYNPTSTEANITLVPYKADGTALNPLANTIDGGERFFGTAKGLNLPMGTAWFRIDSSQPLSGFELFGTSNNNMLAGYSVVNIDRRQGVFPKLEDNGWTGVAFVNTSNNTTNVVLTLYDNEGFQISEQAISLGGHQKLVDNPENIFGGSISAATYIKFSSDEEVVGFQLNGSQNGMMLDALPGM